MKRVFDILFALIVLICFLPIGILLSLWILLESRGGVFFLQNRVGKDGVSFQLLKFRSMHVNAEAQGRITVGSRDSRITKSGYYLRKYKLDEFPQFINVLIGQMSIVGPRPEVKEAILTCAIAQIRVIMITGDDKNTAEAVAKEICLATGDFENCSFTTKEFMKLSEEEKTWIQDAADKSAQAQKKFWNDSVDESMKIAKEAGIEIIIPDKTLFAEKSNLGHRCV